MSSASKYRALKDAVYTRGIPPDPFLDELIGWGKTAPDEIFLPNDNPVDIYGSIKGVLGPWTGLLHRKAAMLEVLRVLAGFESSWNWKEGVDLTNKHSQAHIEGQETGIFQVSFDSTGFDKSLKDCLLRHGVTFAPKNFIDAMKFNHQLALEYCARLLRSSIAWDGPLKRREAHPWMRRDAVIEFEALLK